MASAYRPEQTVTPPESIEKLPFNLGIGIATLNGVDFSKPWNHPNNRKACHDIGAWCRRTSYSRVQLYPTTYPRPIISYPLVANIHRLAENLRVCRGYNVWTVTAEFGSTAFDTVGFNDLRLYLLSCLVRDVDADEEALIRDFMANCYGRAAEAMFAYYRELEKLEAEFSRVLRWNPDIRFISYATPDRLRRWEKDFDRMAELVRDEPRALLHVRRARYNLDQTVIANWRLIPEDGRTELGVLDRVAERAHAISRSNYADTFASLPTACERWRMAGIRVRWQRFGLDQFEAMARPGKPLPAAFAKFPAEHVVRLLPNRNKLGLDADPEAPLGLCNIGTVPQRRNIFHMDYVDNYKPIYVQFGNPVTVERLEKAGPGYRYHFLGAVKLTPDCMVSIHAVSPQSNIFLGHLFEPEAPDLLFDLYLMVNYDRERGEIRVGELVVVRRPDKRDGGDGKDRELDIVIHDFA